MTIDFTNLLLITRFSVDLFGLFCRSVVHPLSAHEAGEKVRVHREGDDLRVHERDANPVKAQEEVASILDFVDFVKYRFRPSVRIYFALESCLRHECRRPNEWDPMRLILWNAGDDIFIRHLFIRE